MLLALLCGGCAGHLIDAFEARQVHSCIWWHDPFGTSRGVTATGGVPIQACLERLGVSP